MLNFEQVFHSSDMSLSDWGDWPKAENTPDVDAMLDDYKKDSDPMMDSKPSITSQVNHTRIYSTIKPALITTCI